MPTDDNNLYRIITVTDSHPIHPLRAGEFELDGENHILYVGKYNEYVIPPYVPGGGGGDVWKPYTNAIVGALLTINLPPSITEVLEANNSIYSFSEPIAEALLKVFENYAYDVSANGNDFNVTAIATEQIRINPEKAVNLNANMPYGNNGAVSVSLERKV